MEKEQVTVERNSGGQGINLFTELSCFQTHNASKAGNREVEKRLKKPKNALGVLVRIPRDLLQNLVFKARSLQDSNL